MSRKFTTLLEETRRVLTGKSGKHAAAAGAKRGLAPVFLDAAGTPMAGSVRRHQPPAATELYDIGMLCDRPGWGGHSYEDDSTVVLLQDRTKQLAADNSRLREEVRRLEGHLRRLQAQCHELVEPLTQHTIHMEERLRQIALELARRDDVSPKSGSARGQADTMPPQGSLLVHGDGEHFQVVHSGRADEPQSAPTTGNAGSSSPLEQSPATSALPVAQNQLRSESKLQRNDALHAAYDQFRKDGFRLLWHVMHLTFSREFEAVCATPQDDTEEDAVAKFQAAFHDKVASAVADRELLREKMSQCEAPLREYYIANCMHAKVRTNTGVLELLGEYRAARDVTSFSLGTNLLGEARIMPLLPLFTQMPRLTTLDLSSNGLRNRALQGLCSALTGHPAIREIDVSSNPFSRLGGKALLQLALNSRQITKVRCEHTQMETSLRDRIVDAARRNASGQAHETTMPSPDAGELHENPAR
jgi:hypothetical protein